MAISVDELARRTQRTDISFAATVGRAGTGTLVLFFLRGPLFFKGFFFTHFLFFTEIVT